MTAPPMSLAIDGDVDCGETSRFQASSGTGRTTSRSLTSAASGARSSPAASRLRTRPAERAALAERPRRTRGEAADRGRRGARVAPVTPAPPRCRDRAFGGRARPGSAICRLATNSQASSPRRRTTRSSVEGQPIRQASKPRRWRGCRARTSSVARSRSGTNPAGAEMTSRTASAAEAPSYARCLALRRSGAATLTTPYAPRIAASGWTNMPGSRNGTETSGEVTANRPYGAHGQPRGVPSRSQPPEPSPAGQGAYLKWDSVETDQQRADACHLGATDEDQDQHLAVKGFTVELRRDDSQ